MVFTQRGSMPIVLTAPHGGSESAPLLNARSRGVLSRDAHTLPIAKSVASHLERELCARPYVVAALVHRKFVDANRQPSRAYEDPIAEPIYRAYHAPIESFVREVRGRWPGRGVLIDLHGQRKHPGSIVCGTRNGKTVRALLGRCGALALSGPEGLFGRLRTLGYDVLPSAGEPELPGYLGHFTVGRYGSESADGIDAIQVEIGTSLRRGPGARARLSRDLAAAIAGFWRSFVADDEGPSERLPAKLV